MTFLISSFLLIFIAELPDKTLYTVLVLASRGRARPVFFGACAAFLVHGFIAAGLGQLFAQLPAQSVRYGASALFLAFGVLLLARSGAEEKEAPPDRPAHHVFLGAFAMVFMAEWGDATQIGTAALVARAPAGQRMFVLAGATLALWTISLLAVTAGALIGARLPRRLLRRAAGCLFCVFAVISALA